MTTSALAVPEIVERTLPAIAPRVALVGCLAHPASSRRTSLISKALEQAGAVVTVSDLEPRPAGDASPRALRESGRSRALQIGQGARLRAMAAWQGLQALTRATQDGVDVIFNYSESWIYSAPVWRLARRQRIRLVQDCVEWHEPISFAGNSFHPLLLDHRTKRERLAASAGGVTVITTRLDELYSQRGVPTFLLPPLCDPSEFELLERRRIESFGVFELVVVASGKPADGDDLIRPILEAAYRLGARFNVTIIGLGDPFGGTPLRTAGPVDVSRLANLRRAEYLRALARADVFLLPRRGGLYSEAAFPNRVPEFLASGGLLLTANVGDLPRYIRHGETGLLCSAGDIDGFAAALDWVSEHRHEAADIGSNGRRAALRQFDYRAHGDALLEFLLGSPIEAA